MNKLIKTLCDKNLRYFFVGLIALSVAFILTIISALGLCSITCAKANDYTLFGGPFQLFGFLFFAGLIILQLLTLKYNEYKSLLALLIYSALGAEIYFIWIQKVEIGTFCPVCISIALCILIAAFAATKNINHQGVIMSKFQKGLTFLASTLTGFVIAFFGVAEVDVLEAKENNLKKELAFGKQDSPIEMYLFSDWACPACRQLEPKLEHLSAVLMTHGKLYFIDHAIHPETLNFTPYHLSFMLHDKNKYFQLREILSQISDQTKSPTDDEVEKAIKKVGVKYDQVDYADVALALRYFKSLGMKFNINGTPTLVIINTETKKGKKLKGSDAINEKNALEAIAAIETKK